ncbi:FadR/GntR family transcriptional regulator [Paenibacillus sacheonensis]|uniref:FCD domain-containing protein n=1 Tax=Paenibacillus sacheonensis TaxID=742054 RepID=A0A7X4YJF8_9BACL|nr:FadR/GntR family transcriptional regulator [Paenibacillus sacheonensis]MBM7564160.1 DNA-binding FadR family transcriptional regulator [Paenibacillus sacheonensis]NBC67511.1 FCD domain-containing protein [Paenibacillus sacheonensis]
MEVTRLSKRNHYEEIAEQLKRLILDGKLKVGDKLPSTKDMSEQFGVGRSTMREALSALKAMGYIEIRQGGGCTVISSAPVSAPVELPELETLRMNRETLLELLEARHALEVSNASIAAEKATPEDIALLQGLVREMEAAIGDDLEGERTDLLFHLTLAKATHNSIMLRLFESIVGQLETVIRDIRRVEIYANHSVAERLYSEHLAIFEAVSERDAAAASQRMKAHLEHVVSNLMRYL